MLAHHEPDLTLSGGPDRPPSVAIPAFPRRRGRWPMTHIADAPSPDGNAGMTISVRTKYRTML